MSIRSVCWTARCTLLGMMAEIRRRATAATVPCGARISPGISPLRLLPRPVSLGQAVSGDATLLREFCAVRFSAIIGLNSSQ